MIPVQRPYLGGQELEAVGEVFDSRWLGMGSATKRFEDEVARIAGAKHALAVNTGTSALHIALAALELQPGDEVIVPSLTFVASIQAILAAGARPVFCEVSPQTLNMDVADMRSRITSRTRVVMPVHYGGLACDMAAIEAVAAEHGLRIVEDAAHAFGSRHGGRPIGSGNIACFSFDPIKNITCGEGGAVTSSDDALVERMRAMRILGIDNDTWSRYRNQRNWFYSVSMPGFRYHMSNLNAAIGLAQIPRMEEFRSRKVGIVERYDAALAGLPGIGLVEHDRDNQFPFFYIVRVEGGRRDQLMLHLKEREIASGVHYIPNHIQPLFERYATSLPATERLYEEILTLPLFFEMTDAEADRVVAAVAEFCAAVPAV